MIAIDTFLGLFLIKIPVSNDNNREFLFGQTRIHILFALFGSELAQNLCMDSVCRPIKRQQQTLHNNKHGVIKDSQQDFKTRNISLPPSPSIYPSLAPSLRFLSCSFCIFLF